MLYEVITCVVEILDIFMGLIPVYGETGSASLPEEAGLGVIEQHRVTDLQSMVMVSDSVITSYSIHYTKLYEL